jgi:hypothetical protein
MDHETLEPGTFFMLSVVLSFGFFFAGAIWQCSRRDRQTAIPHAEDRDFADPDAGYCARCGERLQGMARFGLCGLCRDDMNNGR